MIINKLVKILLLMFSYLILLIILYNFTDILQGTSIKNTLFMIMLTTVYSYLISAIEKGTFRIKLNWLGLALYVFGIISGVLCSGLDQNNVTVWILSIVSTAFLIVGVVRLNE